MLHNSSTDESVQITAGTYCPRLYRDVIVKQGQLKQRLSHPLIVITVSMSSHNDTPPHTQTHTHIHSEPLKNVAVYF